MASNILAPGAKDKLLKLEHLLKKKHPKVISSARNLSENIVLPATGTAAQCWNVIWDKPIWANMKVEVASRNCQALRKWMPEAWKTWGCPGSDFVISRIGKGIRKESYVVQGKLAKEILGETGIARHRLFAIQGAAGALRARRLRRHHPYADLADIDLGEAVKILKAEMGPIWGPTTILHFLTDMGLAAKPDLHVVRTLKHLGYKLKVRDGAAPSEREAIEINQIVSSLVRAVDGRVKGKRLRYFDNVLMEVSRQKLLSKS